MPRPIVFLHLPKTGGQTIHHAIGHHVGTPKKDVIFLVVLLEAVGDNICHAQIMKL